jgi:hypothetical protein
VRANGRRSGCRSKYEVDNCAVGIHVAQGNVGAVDLYGELVCDGDEEVGMRRREVRAWQAFGRRGLVASEVGFEVAGTLTVRKARAPWQRQTANSLTLIEPQGRS